MFSLKKKIAKIKEKNFCKDCKKAPKDLTWDGKKRLEPKCLLPHRLNPLTGEMMYHEYYCHIKNPDYDCMFFEKK